MIENAGQGLLEWQQADGEKMRDFRIVHADAFSLLDTDRPNAPADKARSCRKSETAYVALDDIVAVDRLGRLLNMVAPSPFGRADHDGPEVEDLGQWAELMRCLMVPF